MGDDHKTTTAEKEITGSKVKIKDEPIDFDDEFVDSESDLEELDVRIEVQLEKLPEEEENRQDDQLLDWENLVQVEIQEEDTSSSSHDNAEISDLRPNNNSSYKVQQNSIAEAESRCTSASTIIRPNNVTKAQSPGISSAKIRPVIVCPKCNRTFKTVPNLNRHSCPYYCKDCRRLFDTKTLYEDHLESSDHLQNVNKSTAELIQAESPGTSITINRPINKDTAKAESPGTSITINKVRPNRDSEVEAESPSTSFPINRPNNDDKAESPDTLSMIIRPNRDRKVEAESPSTLSTINRPNNDIKAQSPGTLSMINRLNNDTEQAESPSTSASTINRPIPQCSKCERIFKTFHNLNKHDCQNYCINCRRLFGTKALYENHLKSNAICRKKAKKSSAQKTKTLHKCEKCDLEFPQFSSLAEHVRLSHGADGDDGCVCKHCGKVCLKPWILKIHLMRIHDEGKTTRYTCKTCKKVFRTVTGIKQHNCCVCLFCGKMFAKQRELGEHTLSAHAEGERPSFQCSQCDKKYLHPKTLRTHVGKCHNKDVKGKSGYYECQECEKKFTYQHRLKIHLRHVHCITSSPD